MKRLLWIGWLGWLLTLSGCAYLSSLDSHLPETIEAQIAAGEYGQALDTLAWVKPDHPEYARLMRLRDKALTLARKLETETLRKATRLEQQGEWFAAQQQYEQALTRYGNSEKLSKAYAAFRQRRERYLHKLELALLINRANWLIRNAPIHKEVVRVLPEDHQRFPALRDYRKQVYKTAKGLDRCLQEALAQKRTKLLETCLQLRLKLATRKRDDALIDKARKALAQHRAQARREENAATRKLIAELKQGYSHENLRRARQHLDRLRKTGARDKTSRRLQKTLETFFRRGIEQGITAGRRLYSRGDVAGALQIWQSLAHIDPGNTKLDEHIRRAERVLKKLERLGKEGAKVIPPEGSGD